MLHISLKSLPNRRVCLRFLPYLYSKSAHPKLLRTKSRLFFLMILGEEEADIPTYFNDDEPRKRKKERLFAGSDYFAQLIGAQVQAQPFYESVGFCQISGEYLEDGIPHIYMLYGE